MCIVFMFSMSFLSVLLAIVHLIELTDGISELVFARHVVADRFLCIFRYLSCWSYCRGMTYPKDSIYDTVALVSDTVDFSFSTVD